MSAIGFGCWAIGGIGWGRIDDAQSAAAITRALDLGITLFDTAEGYGLGHSEEVLGTALRNRRHQVTIATKGGLDWGQFAEPLGEPHVGMAGRPYPGVFRNSTPRHLRSSLEASLRRLKTDHVDLYQIHWPDPRTPFSETAGFLGELIREGKVRYVGVSNFSKGQLEEWLKYGPIHTMQPPYSLFDRSIEAEILPFSRERGIGVLAYAPLAHGLLSGKYSAHSVFPDGDFRATHPMFGGPEFRSKVGQVERLKELAIRWGRSAAELAIGWVLARAGITSALVGAKSPSQVDENVRAADRPLSSEELSALEKLE